MLRSTVVALMACLALVWGSSVSAQTTGGGKKTQGSKQTKQSKSKSSKSKGTTQKKPGSGASGTATKPDQKAQKPPKEQPAPVNYGALPITKLFNGKDLTGWKLRHPEGKNFWTVTNGVLANTESGTDLVSDEKFTDFELHVEVNVPKGGNSGVYLQGRYEIQVSDSFGMTDLTNSMMGAIYSKIVPSMNAAKPVGEWQTLDVHFQQAVKDASGAVVSKAIVTVVLNDEIIVDRGEIDGPTGGALDAVEGTPGPIMLQGDHTAVQYRNLIVRKLPAREPPKADEEEDPPIPPKPPEKDKDSDK
ncbi:MAG: DUF1080 domain-containing protein [Armatimonadetes bacterium]|nr:DUF1080 domain-containing protein [Armatimonadota bacterium]